MKRTWNALLALSLVFCFALAGCAPKAPAPSASNEPSAQPTDTPAPSAPVGMDVNLAVLSGPTGVGAAKLLADSEEGVTTNRYHYTICTDNQQVMAGLTSGEFDIAALATNVASTLYNKSEGSIQIAAINTLGVLYILGPADAPIQSMGELRGKKLYATGQGANPEYVLNYLLTENELDPAKDVDIIWGTPEEVNVAMLQGEADYCMLPVPAATALEAKSEGKLTAHLSLSDQWDELRNGSQLTMGCIVVRTQFAQEHPEAVEEFLREYKGSIEYMSEPGNLADETEMNPARLVERYGIAPSAGIAMKAIPQCNLVCVTGTDMRSAIQGYYEVLYAADPAAIGGSIPDDGFYFLTEQ